MFNIGPFFSYSDIALYALALLAAYYLLRWLDTRFRRLPYPPGPQGWPLVGNLSLPTSPAYEAYRAMSDEYGKRFACLSLTQRLQGREASDVIRYNVLGTNVIVLNTLQSATDLLDKRSSIYSDRCALLLYCCECRTDAHLTIMHVGQYRG